MLSALLMCTLGLVVAPRAPTNHNITVVLSNDTALTPVNATLPPAGSGPFAVLKSLLDGIKRIYDSRINTTSTKREKYGGSGGWLNSWLNGGFWFGVDHGHGCNCDCNDCDCSCGDDDDDYDSSEEDSGAAGGGGFTRPTRPTARPPNKPPLPTCNCSCGIANQNISSKALQSRIVGGSAVRANEYPWLARIDYRQRFHCGGSLINRDYVLTAAHCVHNHNRASFRVVLGDHSRLRDGGEKQTRYVSEVVSHAQFSMRTMFHDIALLRLDKPATFTDIVRPVCLPAGDKDWEGKTASVVGWGTTSDDSAPSVLPLQIEVPVYSAQRCRRFRYRPSEISDNMICAGGDTKDSCQGDSGGPLQIKNSKGVYDQAGIVSWGNGCGRRGYPGVYTNICKYYSWLLDNMRDTCVCIS